VKIVLATEIGTMASLRIYTYHSKHGKCSGRPRGQRGGVLSYHNAQVKIKTSTLRGDFGFAGRPEDYSGDPRWPDRCDGCKVPWGQINAEPVRQIFHSRLWDTESGELGPGCMFWSDWDHWEESVGQRIRDGKVITYRVPTTCPHGWSNCQGRHLHAICPDGHEWDIDGRASNCTRPEDQEHRCWIRTGEPPDVTAGKTGGDTCSAGAGSIATPSWHGFLRSGRFVG